MLSSVVYLSGTHEPTTADTSLRSATAWVNTSSGLSQVRSRWYQTTSLVQRHRLDGCIQQEGTWAYENNYFNVVYIKQW